MTETESAILAHARRCAPAESCGFVVRTPEEERYFPCVNISGETATELVEDTQAIARYGRNVTKMDAFGCTSRGQAHRAGLWLIKTELLETQTVDFSVGAEGLRHVPGDVIEICDDDYAGIRTGGRVLAVNSQTRTLTLDREITLPSSGTTLISLVDGQGSPVSVEVQSVTDGVKVKVSRVPDGVAEYSVWGLKLPTLRQRLFRCVSIRENDDGTYAITAVQHVPEKEAIVDNGAHFDGDQSGTVNGVTPPAVQHLTAEVTADSGEYQVLARWDTPKVVKGVSFLLRLTVAADDGRERLVSTARTTETTYRFTQLALGNYRLTVRAVNAWGQQGDPASVSFRIAAPAAPSRIELTPGYFQITATPHLAVYDPTVQFEFWFSEKRIADIRQVETSARYLGTALYWIPTHCPALLQAQVHTRILSVLVLIRTPLRLVHMDTPSPLTLLVTRKTPSKTSHLTIL